MEEWAEIEMQELQERIENLEYELMEYKKQSAIALLGLDNATGEQAGEWLAEAEKELKGDAE